MAGFIENLRLLNRQERFHLLALTLDNPTLSLGTRFRTQLNQAFGLAVPANAFVAVDYQLSWLYAAAVLTSEPSGGPFVSGGGIERGNQEHADLLVAFETNDGCHVLVLEEKGVTDWSHRRLLTKALWLGDIFGFGATADRLGAIQPHFGIVSPFQPADLEIEEWPLWMTGSNGEPAWVRMPLPEDFVKIVRCDSFGKPNANGGHWRPELDRVAARQALPEERRRGRG